MQDEPLRHRDARVERRTLRADHHRFVIELEVRDSDGRNVRVLDDAVRTQRVEPLRTAEVERAVTRTVRGGEVELAPLETVADGVLFELFRGGDGTPEGARAPDPMRVRAILRRGPHER